MNKLSIILLVLTSALISSCAIAPHQASLGLSQDYYTKTERVVGVYMKELPKPDTHLVGASCLLCYAAASAANSSLTSHVELLSTAELADLGVAVEKQLSSKGIKVVPIAVAIDFESMENYPDHAENFSYLDMRPLREKLGVDQLVVISINAMGAYRPYSSYVPTGGASGTVMGAIYMVDLVSNKYELYDDIDYKIVPEGEWDEPPGYPGVTNAYYQAIELTKNKVDALFK